MRYIATAFAIAALLSLAGSASAQMYAPYSAPTSPYYSAAWPEMMDNGCCTDFPTHTATDYMAGQLNQQVLNYNAQPPMYPAPVYMLSFQVEGLKAIRGLLAADFGPELLCDCRLRRKLPKISRAHLANPHSGVTHRSPQLIR